MECLVIENGVERNANLDDLLPILGENRIKLQQILKKACEGNFSLKAAITDLSEETKEIVYNNVPLWLCSALKKPDYLITSMDQIWYAQHSKQRLIEIIGNNNWGIQFPKHIIWKDDETQKIEKALLSPHCYNSSVSNIVSPYKNDKEQIKIEVIPQGSSISYPCFCNSYYRLVKLLLRLNGKARYDGLFEIEEEIDLITDHFLRLGLKLVVDGIDSVDIRQMLTARLERELDYYRKKLMEAAMEGILCLQCGEGDMAIIHQLNSLVNIKNNPIDTAIIKYYAGDIDAISNIDFDAAIIEENEREEIRFIKRAIQLSEITHKEGYLALEKYLDHEGITQHDVFEYGLLLILDGRDLAVQEKILDNLIEHETDPIRRNLTIAKKQAVISIAKGRSQGFLIYKLCSYFDKVIETELMNDKL